MKPRENTKKRFFRHISGIFGRKKIFSKIGLSHILGIASTRLCAKNREKKMMKSRENAKKLFFPAFLAGKKIFSKIGLGHISGIASTRLCAKNQKKLMMKSRENAKELVFPAYFRHFRPEKYVFQKSGSVTF